MSTVKKGNDFEEYSKKLIISAIEKGDLQIPGYEEKIYSKKGYYSEKRKKDIIFDLAIEIWSPNANKFQLIYLIECKDYSNKPIPVDDLEEFDSKINQVAPRNSKGIFITNTHLQEGALNFANSQGIMVIQALEENNYKIVLFRKERNPLRFNLNSIKEKEELIDVENRIETFFNNLFAQEEEKIIGFNYYKKEGIEIIANQLLEEYDPLILKKCRKINIPVFKEFLKMKYKINNSKSKVKDNDTFNILLLSLVLFS